MNCAACRRACRVTKIAAVASKGGAVKSARVCKACFDAAVHLVPHVLIVAKDTDETKIARRNAASVVKSAAKKLRAMANGYRGVHREDHEMDSVEGRILGLEQAADILDAGDF